MQIPAGRHLTPNLLVLRHGATRALEDVLKKHGGRDEPHFTGLDSSRRQEVFREPVQATRSLTDGRTRSLVLRRLANLFAQLVRGSEDHRYRRLDVASHGGDEPGTEVIELAHLHPGLPLTDECA